MAYFEPYIDAEGVHTPTYDEVLEYLMENYRAIFGEDVYLGEETPDYQLISLVAKCMTDYSNLATQAYYERNPYYASGNSLDLLVQLSGLTRRQPTASKAILVLSGAEGTVIEAGKQAIDETGNIWTIQFTTIIPAEGEAEVYAICDTLGAIAAPVGAISGIYTPIPGWEGVTNEIEAEIGTDLETDAELRIRFAATHAMSNSGIESSFITGLLSLDGVKHADIVSNNTDDDNTGTGGLPPHSFCAVVDGGDADEIAEKILYLKAPGVATAGGVEKTVTDSDGHEYTIKFSRPTATAVPITVTVKDLGGYDPSRSDAIIKAALEADINSLGIGKSWALTMGYKDIYSQFSGSDMPFAVVGITSSAADGNGIVECAFDHILTVADSNITITVAT